MVSAVVLAAGASTRMGAQKLLLPLGGEPIVRRTVRQICDTGVDEVLVIVGHEHENVLEALKGLAIRYALNEMYQEGMGSSFRTAVEHLGGSDAAMFALADQPFVTTKEYRAVLDTFLQHAPAIVSVRYGDVTAPPHMFSKELFPELAQLEHGARPVLERHSDCRIVLQFPAELLQDIDTPEDYEVAKRRLSRLPTSPSLPSLPTLPTGR
jgi:molybdenum cofactor cytidylyltransferase